MLENSFNALPLSEQAFKRLRIDILNGSLGPDKQLKVENLKKFYGFSSSPLREALNRLTVEGLVINEERRGFFVSSISVEDINEIAKEKGYVKTGDFLINLSSMPVKEKGMVNTLRVSHIN